MYRQNDEQEFSYWVDVIRVGTRVVSLVLYLARIMAPSTACAATGLTLSFNQGMIVK